MVRKLTPWQATLLALAIAAVPSAASAATGGGGGIFTGIVNYVQSSVIDDLSTLAIIGLGITMLAFRFSLATVAFVCSGIWVVLNPTTIKGWF